MYACTCTYFQPTARQGTHWRISRLAAFSPQALDAVWQASSHMFISLIGIWRVTPLVSICLVQKLPVVHRLTTPSLLCYSVASNTQLSHTNTIECQPCLACELFCNEHCTSSVHKRVKVYNRLKYRGHSEGFKKLRLRQESCFKGVHICWHATARLVSIRHGC